MDSSNKKIFDYGQNRDTGVWLTNGDRNKPVLGDKRLIREIRLGYTFVFIEKWVGPGPNDWKAIDWEDDFFAYIYENPSSPITPIPPIVYGPGTISGYVFAMGLTVGVKCKTADTCLYVEDEENPPVKSSGVVWGSERIPVRQLDTGDGTLITINMI